MSLFRFYMSVNVYHKNKIVAARFLSVYEVSMNCIKTCMCVMVKCFIQTHKKTQYSIVCFHDHTPQARSEPKHFVVYGLN